MRPIILASKSPRRSQLLREAGIAFTVKAFDTDEDFPETMPVREVAPWLAQKKAKAASAVLVDDEIILAADSVVILGETIFNKPENRDEAYAMLRALSGKQHTVVTGVCLMDKTKEVLFSGITEVWFEHLTDSEIYYYIDTYKPYDKAGSYGAQDWIGHCKISRLEGTFQNVMGLPIDLVYKALLTF